jgi:hypothetical protein
MTPTIYPYSVVSALEERAPGRFAGEINAEWAIRGKPNGGYLVSMMARAATQSTEHRHLLAASAHFVSAPDPGSAEIATELLRAGRSASQSRVTMSQDGKIRVEALITTSRLDEVGDPYWEAGLPVPNSVDFEDCIHLVPKLSDGERVELMEQVAIRLEPSSCGFFEGRPSGRGELRGWLALPHEEPFDSTALAFAVDAFPPATFDIEMAGWVPTLELTVYVRALPAPGPLRVLQRAQMISGQRVDEACFVWDHTGRLVAQGTQLAGIRLG